MDLHERSFEYGESLLLVEIRLWKNFLDSKTTSNLKLL